MRKRKRKLQIRLPLTERKESIRCWHCNKRLSAEGIGCCKEHPTQERPGTYVIFDDYGNLDWEVAKTLPKALKKARRILQKVAEEGNVDAVTIYKEVCTLRLKDPL